MTNVKEDIIEYLNKNIQTKEELKQKHLDSIDKIVKEILKAFQNGNKVVWFGNGGSAADAQHLACELVSKLCKERKALPSIAFTTNTSELTAIANDYDFSQVFARQVEALVDSKDIVIGISTSGNSESVIKGLEQAKKQNAVTIAFTGKNGGLFKENKSIDHIFNAPSDVTSHIQECHITVGHIICSLVEDYFSG